ncbi:MAG: DNA recombination protein RmuC [Campylobacter sp.]|nr:DNA recombination protein RmuC [Campylobacter sp.]
MSEFEIVSVVVLSLFFLALIVVVFLLLRQRELFNAKISELERFLTDQNSKNQSISNDINDALIDRFFDMSRSINQTISNTQNSSANSLNSLEFKFNSLLSKINELKSANVGVDALKDEVIKLNSVFSNSKLRGNYGEFELEKVLRLSYGENSNFYKLQKIYSNGLIVDACLKLKKDLILPIDSKFPLSNYQKILSSQSKNEQKLASKALEIDMKKHIDDISIKYILPPKTTEYAVLFLPSEAIFAYICESLPQVLEYGYEKAIFISSPSTLMALLYSFELFLRDEQINENASAIRDEIYALSNEFNLFKKHNKQALSYATKLRDAINLINDSSDIISNKFDKISKF